jgi:hypothetical protein
VFRLFWVGTARKRTYGPACGIDVAQGLCNGGV